LSVGVGEAYAVGIKLRASATIVIARL